ncbi:hypothetical protein AVEN_102671-1 [Araneus ventricosus]|uniref:DUF4817 domain-containing protein n=1 Tax=Araneus ventricosus TaxID=182803 RepID=A0A4Y2KDU5_ARAVE|nr:hypothetical protein AVEN_102671-1 [Araneus ventricosus]
MEPSAPKAETLPLRHHDPTMQEKAYCVLEFAKTSSVSVVHRHFHARAPDLTPCDFFLWGFVKDKVFVLPLPHNLQELKQRITNVLNALTGDLLSRVWEEVDYRMVDICRVTGGAHVEHL